jgi:ABC-2 type transport system ATP-binding protein
MTSRGRAKISSTGVVKPVASQWRRPPSRPANAWAAHVEVLRVAAELARQHRRDQPAHLVGLQGGGRLHRGGREGDPQAAVDALLVGVDGLAHDRLAVSSARQDLRGAPVRWTASTSTSSRARCTPSSAPTAPASRRRSASCSDCFGATPARHGCSAVTPGTTRSTLHRRLAYVPGDVHLWPNLTGGEAIDLLGSLRGGLDEKRRDALVERFQLDPTKRADTYSKGNRQKVALIAAFASDVELYLLDEPTSGLDPLMEQHFRDVVRDVTAAGRTVLLSSHILAEAEALSDRVSIIRQGRIVESGSLAELRHLTRTSVTVATRRPLEGLVRPAGRPRRRRGRDQRTLRGRPRPPRHGARPPDRGRCDGADQRAPTLAELFLRHYGDDLDAGRRGRIPTAGGDHDGAGRYRAAATARPAARPDPAARVGPEHRGAGRWGRGQHRGPVRHRAGTGRRRQLHGGQSGGTGLRRPRLGHRPGRDRHGRGLRPVRDRWLR